MGGARGGDGYVYGAARRSVLAAAAAAALTAAPNTAGAFDARLGWSPVLSAAGYRLYVRQSGQMYGTGADLGLVLSDPDGVVRYVVRGLPDGILDYFAVTAYGVSGQESALSNELSLLVTATPTVTSSAKAAPSLTPSASASPSRSPTGTATRTPIASATAARTPTVSVTTTLTPTASRTATAVALPDATRTPTTSPTTIAGSGYGMSGRISYFSDNGPVPAATLTLHGAQGALATATDGLGQFVFAGVAPGTWLLEPQKQGGFQNAISSLDAAFVLEAVSGLRTLDPLAALACDVTGDGTLSALDAAFILQFNVGLIDQLPAAQSCGSDWVFVPQPLSVPLQQLVWPQSNGTGCQPGGIAFQPLQSAVAQQDFAAALFGDCTGNWRSGSGAALRLRSDAAQAWLGIAHAQPGRRWVVPLYVLSRNPVEGLTAHIGYDPADDELEAVRPVGTATDAMMYYRADDASGRAAIALASDQPLPTGDRPLAMLVFRATNAPQVQLLDALVDEAAARVTD